MRFGNRRWFKSAMSLTILPFLGCDPDAENHPKVVIPADFPKSSEEYHARRAKEFLSLEHFQTAKAVESSLVKPEGSTDSGRESIADFPSRRTPFLSRR